MATIPKCPEVCDTKVSNHEKTLYDPTTGLAACIRKKVSWTHLGVIVFSILTLFSGVYLYGAEKKDKKIDKVEQTAIANTQTAEVVKRDIQHIKEDMAEQKSDIKEIKNTMVKKEDLDAKFDLIIKAIKREH